MDAATNGVPDQILRQQVNAENAFGSTDHEPRATILSRTRQNIPIRFSEFTAGVAGR
jgi:hypothetical protein